MPLEHTDSDMPDPPPSGSNRREFLQQTGVGALSASLAPGKMMTGAEAAVTSSSSQSVGVETVRAVIGLVDWDIPPTPEEIAGLNAARRAVSAARGEWQEIVAMIDRRLAQASIKQALREPPKPKPAAKEKEEPATAAQLQTIADCINVMCRMREEHLRILSFSIEYLARVSNDPAFIRRAAFAMIRQVIDAHPEHRGDENRIKQMLFAA